jgi:predicted ATPase/DNA-binding winged helix-turn-helix (wHTH) protein
MAGQPEDPVTIDFGRFKVVRHRRELLADGLPVELGGRAFDTLMALIEARGTVLSKDELMSRVWPDRVVEENNLAAQISVLRQVFGADRHLIRTVAGRGYQFTGEIRETAAPAAGPAPSRTTNLPEALSELIGRETELGEVTALTTEHRLVSLVGAGGIGKTRLGLEVARHLLPRFPDGVFVAELGPLSSPDLVPTTVASALGLTHVAGTLSPEGVAGAVGTKKLLLVIDNCEHVIEAAAGMAEALLRASPGASLLATSRESLRISGEHVYRVPPLDVPAEDSQDTEDVFGYGAVRLFVARAHAAEPRYVAEGRVAAATAAICRRLDGIPLAIELAATHTVAFGVSGVAARLDDRFRLLTGGSRTALPRHQTMRATLDWSHELLSESERVVLRRLGVFVGAFTLDAASAVAASVDILAPEVVDSIANLVEKSLLSADVGGTIVRYRLLETTRAYAREKLSGSAEFEPFARRHAEYFRDLLEHAEAELETRPTAEWLPAYRPHIDDLRAALDWAFSPSGDVGVGMALTAAAVPLWAHLSLLTECRARVEQAIAGLGREVPSDPRRDMRLYLALGHVLLQNIHASARAEVNATLTKALELAEIADDGRYRLAALHGLYLARLYTGEYRNALNLAEKFRTVATDTAARSDVPIGNGLIGLTLHVLGDQPGARRHLEPLVGSDFVTARPSHLSFYRYDHRIVFDCYYARVLWLQGFGDKAKGLTEKLVDYARTIDHLRSFLYTLLIATCPIAVFVGDLATIEHHVRLAFDLAARHSLEFWNVWAQCFEGILLIKRGENLTGSQLLQSALERLPEPSFHYHMSSLLAELAAGLGGAGQIAEGLVVVDKALARAEQTEEGWYLAELLRTKGELHLLERLPTAVETAEKCFHRALDVARDQGALSWELRAAMSLARFWRGQQRVSHARKLLAPVYRRFTEGFGTADLIAAKALLASVR